MNHRPGKVYLVGAGPGAPDLLTLRAARLLAEADIVLHDALVHPQTLALALRARRIPVGKRCGAASVPQALIHRYMIEAAYRHRVVVRLQGGDPMLFGRAQEEIDALCAAGIPNEVVPGITAALAAAAQHGVSLTRRSVSRSVTFATPRQARGAAPAEWVEAARNADTVAIYMGARQAAGVMSALIGAGRSPTTPVLVCADVSLPGSRNWAGTLAELPALARDVGESPAIILVGAVFRELAAAAVRKRGASPLWLSGAAAQTPPADGKDASPVAVLRSQDALA